MKIALQPAGNDSSLEHFETTGVTPRPLDEIRGYLSSELYAELLEIYPDKKAYIWGVAPMHYKDPLSKRKDGNKTKWLNIDEGETQVLFSRKNRCFAKGLITKITHNKKLAKKLWGINEYGATWEYIYFVKDLTSIDIPVQIINKHIDYPENKIIQGFSVLNDKKSKNLLKFLGSTSNKITISKAAEKALSNLKKPSTISDIKKEIIKKNYYNFGAKKENIDSTIRIAINRFSDNGNRIDSSDESIFHKYDKKLYGLVEWFTNDLVIDEDSDEVETKGAIEGAKKTIVVNAYERNPKNRKKCLKIHGYVCKVCGFDFLKRYGPIGKDFIHVHHTKPLGEVGEEYEVNPEKDLIPVCPNCHAMLHRKKEALSIEALKKMLRDYY